MNSCQSWVFLCVLFLICVKSSLQIRWTTTDELENHISPEDLREFFQYFRNESTTKNRFADDYADFQETTTSRPLPRLVDCFGLGSVSRAVLSFFNMRPDDTDKVNTHFYFSSRLRPKRVQVFPDEQFGLEWVDYNATRKTVIIVHGFLSHSNASWVLDMTRALLEWGDVNVIAVDWSGGGNTWKYWRAVANTRTVGSDITRFLKQLMNVTGARVKDFHFIGHSLGAHISSFASLHCGKVARITGLDPAQPCFATDNAEERLDPSDADFVDVIHTNGRLLQKFGFGMPDPIGHVDFYPNGGIKQPGCNNGTRSFLARLLSIPTARLQQAVCSHGRAYLLFTESLINGNCSFQAYRWDLSLEGVNTSLNSTCDRKGSCAEMGISAPTSKARGPYFLLTTDKEPYCATSKERRFPLLEILHDLRMSFSRNNTTRAPRASEYADPDVTDLPSNTVTDLTSEVTTKRSWFCKIRDWFTNEIFRSNMDDQSRNPFILTTKRD